MNYYEVLGVPESATAEEIKKAYRKKVFESHPDRNQGKEQEAKETMASLNEAYEVLSDPAKKRLYDEERNFSFADLLRNAGRRAQQMSKTIVQYSLNLPIEKFITGTTMKIPLEIPSMMGMLSGRHHSAEIEVSIPPKFPVGGFVMVNKEIGGMNVEARIQFMPQQTEKYRFLPNLDICTIVPIPVLQFLIGGSVQVPLIEGGTKELSIPPGTKLGEFLELPEEGVYHRLKGQRGPLFVVCEPIFPEEMDSETRELLERAQERLNNQQKKEHSKP